MSWGPSQSSKGNGGWGPSGGSGGGSGGWGPSSGGSNGKKKSPERAQRNPKKEVVRGLARYLKSSSNLSQGQLLQNAAPYVRGLTPKEIRNVSVKADIPTDVEDALVRIARTQRVSEKELAKDPGLDLNPIAQGISAFGWALRQASRPGQAVVSGVAEYSRQAEKNPEQIGPVSVRLPSIFSDKLDQRKILQRAGEGFMLKRSDTPVTIATEAGRIRKKQNAGTQSFGFVPGTNLETGQALPGGIVGKATYDIGGMIVLDPLTYATFGGSVLARGAMRTAESVLGAERAAVIATKGAKVLSAEEKARLGKDTVRALRGLRPGVKVRVPQPIRAARGGKLLSAPQTVIPYGAPGRAVVKGAQRARDLPGIRALDTAFVPRAAIRRAERQGLIAAGTTDDIDRIRVQFNASGSADADLSVLKNVARRARLTKTEAEEVAFALEEAGGREALRTEAQKMAYDALDQYRRQFSDELRKAGVISTADEVTQKRIQRIRDQANRVIEPKLKKLDALQKKRAKAGSQFETADERRAALEELNLERAEAANAENAIAREAELERRAVADIQRGVKREVVAEGAGARRAAQQTQKRAATLQRRYEQVRKTLGARLAGRARAALKEAQTEVSSLKRGIDSIESKITTLRNQRARIRILTPANRQRLADIDEQIANLSEDLRASRAALAEATPKIAEAQRNLDEIIGRYGQTQVSKEFADTPIDELMRLERKLEDDALRAMTAADEAAATAERLAPGMRRALESEPISRQPLVRMPGKPRPEITPMTARQRELVAKRLERLRAANAEVRKMERSIQRVRQLETDKVSRVVPGIEDEFYVPHVPSIASKQRELEDVDKNLQTIDLISQNVKVDRRRPGFVQARKSGLSLREKVASDNARYLDTETNPFAAFATHAIQGRREIATRQLIANLSEMVDSAGQPLMQTTDDYLQFLKDSGFPGLEEFDDIADIPKSLREEIIGDSGRSVINVQKIGPNGETLTFLVPKYLDSFVSKTAGLIGKGEMAGFLRGIDRWMSLWKSYATLPFPFGAGFSLRNGSGNVTLNWLANIQPTDRAYRDALKLQRKIFKVGREGNLMNEQALRAALTAEEYEIFTNAMQREIFGSGFNAVDLTTDPLFSFRSRRSRQISMVNPVDQQNIALRVGRAFNSMIENNARLAHFIAQSRVYGNFDDAAASVRKYLFDYGDLTPIEQGLMRRVIPFYTFMRKNTPLWIGAFFTDPVKYSRLEQWRKTMYDIAGRPDMGVVPSYLEAGGAFPSPISLGGLPTLAGPDLPPGAASDVLTPLLSLPGINKLGIVEKRPGAGQQSLQQLINMVGGGAPGFIKSLTEIGLGRQAFTGRPFYPGEQVPVPGYLRAIGVDRLLGERVVEGEKGKAIPYQTQYLLEQNLPLLQKLGAVAPQTEAGRDTQLRRLLSTLTGLQLYPLGEPTRRTELFKRVQQINAMLDEIRSQGGTVPENLSR
jgi:hypothetical protein